MFSPREGFGGRLVIRQGEEEKARGGNQATPFFAYSAFFTGGVFIGGH
jgi:hypothetical protein